MFIAKRGQLFGGSGGEGDLDAHGGTTRSVLREAPRRQEESIRKGKSLFRSSEFCLTNMRSFRDFLFLSFGFPLLLFLINFAP